MSRKICIIGASGFAGGSLAGHFVAQGHKVLGLARSERSAFALEAAGIQAVRGDLDADMAPVLAAAQSADVTVYAARVAFEREPAIIRRLCDALAGGGKTFIFLSGSGVFMQRTGGAWSPDSFAEDDPFVPEPLALPRVEAEGIVRAAAEHGLRSMVIRPPVNWGPATTARWRACTAPSGLQVPPATSVRDWLPIPTCIAPTSRGCSRSPSSSEKPARCITPLPAKSRIAGSPRPWLATWASKLAA